LSVQEPVWDFVLAGVEHDGLHATDLVLVQLTGTLSGILVTNQISLQVNQLDRTTNHTTEIPGPFRETVFKGIKWVKCWELISPVTSVSND